MSNIVVPNEAKLNWAQAQIDNSFTLSDCHLRLIKADLTIDRDTTLAELTAIQADYPGYAAVLCHDWSNTVIIEGKAMTEAAPCDYQATEESEQVMHGYYATNGAGDRLLFAGLFDDPQPISMESELQVVVQLDLDSIFNS